MRALPEADLRNGRPWRPGAFGIWAGRCRRKCRSRPSASMDLKRSDQASAGIVASMWGFASREIRSSKARSRTTMKVQGCWLTALGACAAASIKRRMACSSTPCAVYSRVERRPEIASLTSILICFQHDHVVGLPESRHAALIRVKLTKYKPQDNAYAPCPVTAIPKCRTARWPACMRWGCRRWRVPESGVRLAIDGCQLADEGSRIIIHGVLLRWFD